MKRRMWSLALGLVCAGMALSVTGHAGWAPQKPTPVASMSTLDLPALKKPITKRFVNAKLSEVLAWLSLEKFSFVADVSEFPDQGQVTLNFQAQPLGAVLDAIADAYHGRWERRGEIFTLRSGRAAPQTTRFSGGKTAPNVQTAVDLYRQETKGPLTAPKLSGQGPYPPTTARVTTPSIAKGLYAPALALPKVDITRPSTYTVAPAVPSLKAAPKVDINRLYTTPSVAVTAQDPKAREEAMRAAERALREAEETIRKLHESGEWKRAMEKAMAAGQGSEEMHKAMEEAHRAMVELHNSKEWREAWAKAREEIAQALKSGKVKENGKERPMTAKERETLEKTLKNFEKMPDLKFDSKMFTVPKIDQKAFEKLHKLDEKVFVMPKIDSKVFTMPQIDKERFEKMMKDRKNFVMPKIDGDHFRFVFPDSHGSLGDRETEIQKRIQELRRRYGGRGFSEFHFEPGVKGMHEFRLAPEALKRFHDVQPFLFDSKKMNIKELLDSLTVDQKAKMEKNGHLTLDDLTPKQRALLGDLPKEGSWTFSYSVDGKRVTIKGK